MRICACALAIAVGLGISVSAQAGSQGALTLPSSPSWQQIGAELHRLHARYPRQTHLFSLGESARGRPLWALRISSDPDDRNRPSVLLSAGQHANEAAAPLHVLDAARTLLDGQDQAPYNEWLNRLTLIIVPMINPDGNEAFFERWPGRGRKNARQVFSGQQTLGVDLNRNYPFGWDGPPNRFTSADPESRFYRGPAPASEPEVLAIMELADTERFVASISYHSAATRLIVPYSTAGVSEKQPELPWSVGQAMIDKLPHRFKRRRYLATRGLYPVTGIEKDWLYHRHGTLAYVLELPYRRPEGARLEESIVHSRGAWMALFERFCAGPSLSIRVSDEGDTPLEARVEILASADASAVVARDTHQTTGWLHTYLPSDGPVMVRVRARGQVRELTLDPHGGHATVNMTLADEPLTSLTGLTF